MAGPSSHALRRAAHHAGVRKTHRADEPSHFAHRLRGSRSVGGSSESGLGGGDAPEEDDDIIKRYLKKAAEVVADGVREAAEPVSRTTAASVHVEQSDDGKTQVVSGGHGIPGAYFDPPEDQAPSRHPLWGNREYWYDQPYRPYTEEGARATADRAAKVFAGFIDEMARKIGHSRP